MIGRLTIRAVQRAVADEFRVPLRIMSASSRDMASAHPRQISMALSLALTGQSSVVVGRHHGDRDHSTVLYARDIVSRRRDQDAVLRARIERIERRLDVRPSTLAREPVQLAFLLGPLFDRVAA